MKFSNCLVLCFLPMMLIASMSPPRGIMPDQIISGVNALRASQGLAPYVVDSWLMSYAQEHAEYMASLGHGTHTHSDGVVPWEIGLQENVAGGTAGWVTTDFIINQVWADPGHGKVLTGYASGEVGVGVASNDVDVYVSLDVRPGGESYAPTQRATSLGNDAADADPTAVSGTPRPPVPLVTVTPLADGSVYHIVGTGQTLWDIAQAYGITVDRLLLLNGFKDENETIYVGQRLLIELPPIAVTVTVSHLPSATPTIDPTQLTPAATMTATPPAIPTQPPVPSPTPTETIDDAKIRSERLTSTLLLVAVIMAGFILLYSLAFRGTRRY